MQREINIIQSALDTILHMHERDISQLQYEIRDLEQKLHDIRKELDSTLGEIHDLNDQLQSQVPFGEY